MKRIPFFVTVLLSLCFVGCTTRSSRPEGVYSSTLHLNTVGYYDHLEIPFSNMEEHGFGNFYYADFEITIENTDSVNVVKLIANRPLPFVSSDLCLLEEPLYMTCHRNGRRTNLVPITDNDTLANFNAFVEADKLHIDYNFRKLWVDTQLKQCTLALQYSYDGRRLN